ncbi:DUF6771 family protein [uncultured Sphingomonas sp.]|uniref:DUF6771 family protein n=1 Tax=uncultured Sphingomonas sp. TaxID=158754 RepID=UPI0035CA7833
MRDSADTIAAAISAAPGWARVGITVPDPRLRAAALEELARHVVASLDPPRPRDDRQLGLPL